MKYLRYIFLFFLFLFICSNGVAAAPSAELHSLFDRHWQFLMKEYPLYATGVGDHRYDDKLGSVELSDLRRRNDSYQSFRNELGSIPYDRLNRADRINYDILKLKLDNSLTEFDFCTYLMPITARSGFFLGLAHLADDMPFRTVKDYENYISRLSQYSRLTGEYISLMRAGLETGHTPPRAALAGYAPAVVGHIVADARDSLLYEPFEKMPKTFSPEDCLDLRQNGAAAIMNSVVPAYRSLADFLEGEYFPGSRESIAAAALPDGKKFYEYMVRLNTTLDVTPLQVHEIGLSEVSRISGEMSALLDAIGFAGDLSAFKRFLRTDDRFYAKTPEELLAQASYTLKKADGKLPEFFATLPRITYGIEPVPDYESERAAAAYYKPPPGDGTRSGVFYINTYGIESRPLYGLKAIALHEAVPGHHLQIALQHELADLPKFRRYGGFTAFAEGWGLYAEWLGLEMGIYQDPYSDFGRLNMEMWRACRLVVDTGIHYFGWSRHQAIDYLAENTSLSAHNIETEVDRYIGWPGQALAYKMGQLKISELRKKAEQTLGAAFDIRLFHDSILANGSVPLKVLEQNILFDLSQSSEKATKPHINTKKPVLHSR